MKTLKYKLYGLLIPLDLLVRAWESIFLNFIIDLPLSRRRGKVYNAILIIVCRYFKMLRYITYTIEIDASELVKRLYEKIVSKLDILVLIVSDRGRVFTSKWWDIFYYLWNMRRRFLIAFRP
jgi:hypothetical protein